MTLKPSILVLLAVIGCADQATEDVATTTSAVACPIWQCGTNSPEIDNLGFHDLHETGLANDVGLRVTGLKANGLIYRADVRNGKLYGLTSRGVIAVSAALGNLFGADLLISNAQGPKYAVRVLGIDSNVDYWAANGALPTPKLEAYLLKWGFMDASWNQVPGTHWKNICKVPTGARTVDNTYQNRNLNGYYTLLFEGDRINATAKTVDADPAKPIDPNWFNLGCSGSALAKLALTAHTQSAQSAGFLTTTDERTTMLKLFVADYCGDGNTFTIAGQPLQWKTDHDSLGYTVPVTIEARWGPSGVICLETPRLIAHPNLDYVYPGGVETEMIDTCARRPPACSASYTHSIDPNDLAGWHAVSANPP